MIEVTLDQTYYNKLYGGWIGKIIGVIHGANVEGWTYEEIKRTFGTLTDYPFRFRNFCADDDINGPLFFMRVMQDYAGRPDITVKEMAETFLNYVSDEHGFFWWGGYGVSTEHTAYKNLLEGIPAPRCGSAAQNGSSVANQIGGQIFSDCWGFLYPDEPAKAAEMAERMASVTHDENGIYGGRFIAACIAAAFTAAAIDDILDEGLAQIPEDCDYATMVRDVRKQCWKRRSWEEAFRYVQEVYGYQNYPGNCHIIPNAAVIVLAMVYGDGNYSDTVNIANMCGWDTDCNTGNVGAVLGVFNAIDGIDAAWLPQVNDFICASSSIGFLNIQTVSQAAAFTAAVTHRLRGEEPDPVWQDIFSRPEGQYFHFEFPTATHGLRSMSEEGIPVLLHNVEDIAHTGNRCLRITAPMVQNRQSFVIYFKSYYVPSDFDDDRYSPNFAPTVYPGDRIRLYYRFDESAEGYRIRLNPYVTDRISGERLMLDEAAFMIDHLACEQWQELSFRIPAEDNLIIQDVGMEAVFVDLLAGAGHLVMYTDDWSVEHRASYAIEFDSLPSEIWTPVEVCPAGFSFSRRIVELLDGKLQLSGYGKETECYTGSIHWSDLEFKSLMVPVSGSEHYMLLRVQGCRRCYAAGFRDGKAVILKKEGTWQVLAEKAYPWECGRSYELRVQVMGRRIYVWIDGENTLMVEDEGEIYESGCIGFGNECGSRTAFSWYRLKEL